MQVFGSLEEVAEWLEHQKSHANNRWTMYNRHLNNWKAGHRSVEATGGQGKGEIEKDIAQCVGEVRAYNIAIKAIQAIDPEFTQELTGKEVQ